MSSQSPPPPISPNGTAQPHPLNQQRGGSPSTKAARATFAKDTINNVIPHLLKHNLRARLGNASTERIEYSPFVMSIKAGVRSRGVVEGDEEGSEGDGRGKGRGNVKREGDRGASSPRSSPSKKGKITGFFKVLPKEKKSGSRDGDRDVGFVYPRRDGEAISKQNSSKVSNPRNDEKSVSSSSIQKDTPTPTISPHFSSSTTVASSSTVPPPPPPQLSHTSTSTQSNPSSSSTSTTRLPKVTVIQSDTLEAAQAFVDPTGQNRRIAVLNMASFLRPGGGVLQGAIAQEESLCLRSTLYTALDERFYRLPKFGGLFTEDILVFRDIQNRDLPKTAWYYIDVLTIAALKNPDLLPHPASPGKKIYAHEKDKEEMMSKIKLILLTAVQKKTTHLVLGALGCGAYYNPPEEVARMFRRCIFGGRDGRGRLDLSAGVLEEVVFAIFDDGVNLRVFGEVLLGGGGGKGSGGGGGGKVGDNGKEEGNGKGKERAKEDDTEMSGTS